VSKQFQTLNDWLSWQETLHPSEIDLGLERVQQVYQRLHPDQTHPYKVITIAGTNGKGSSAAILSSILLAAGYKVGTYTSPHLFRYNERICINGVMASDAAIVESFVRIDQAREDISLTYFEFGTLAALDIFNRSELDVVVLEVGLGGRLDAVNIIDCDVALITSIGIDHIDWLGPDRESIGKEKAGIMRAGKPVVCSDIDMPASISEYANQIGARLYRIGQEFSVQLNQGDWFWQSADKQQQGLPALYIKTEHMLNNAAGALMVLELLANDLPIAQQHLRQGLLALKLPAGRQQVITEPVMTIVDVSHNVDSVRSLATMLSQQDCGGKTHAVIAMLQDKDISGVFTQMESIVDHWYLASLHVPRGASAEKLHEALAQTAKTTRASCYSSVTAAVKSAHAEMQQADRLVIFGSFYTVAEAMVHSV